MAKSSASSHKTTDYSSDRSASEVVSSPINSATAYNPYAENKSFFASNFSTIILIIVFFFGGFFVGSLWKENQMLRTGTGGTNAAAVPTDAQPPEPAVNFDKLPAVTDEDQIQGNKDAKVVLVEYSDFECPFCGRFHPTTKQVLDEYGDQVALVFRHYPLSFHPNAQKASEGGECVAKLVGKTAFWTYADAIFEVNSRDGELSPEAITEAAALAGANATEFQKCLDSGEMAEVVKNQMSSGSLAGVQGTPGTFVVVDGKAVDFIGGALPYESVKATIDQYINQ